MVLLGIAKLEYPMCLIIIFYVNFGEISLTNFFSLQSKIENRNMYRKLFAHFDKNTIQKYKSSKHKRQVATINSAPININKLLFNMNVSIESGVDYNFKITSNTIYQNKSNSLLNAAIELLVLDTTKKPLVLNSTTTNVLNHANLNIYANINEQFFSWFRILSYIAFSLVIFSSISIIAFICYVFGYRSSTRSRMNLKSSVNSLKTNNLSKKFKESFY